MLFYKSLKVCYIKSLTTAHFLMTILPKTFGDLKSLLVDEASMDGQSPLALSLVQTPIPKVINSQPKLRFSILNH